jgi:hypothetical protein
VPLSIAVETQTFKAALHAATDALFVTSTMFRKVMEH